MSSSSEDVEKRHNAVEVIMPDPEAGVVGSSSVPASASSASSAPANGSSLAEKAISKLPPEIAEQARDPNRKAKSKDPGWKYGFWPTIGKKEFIRCIFCDTVVSSGVGRFKQHLAGGYSDAEKCPNAPEIVRREMHDRLKQNARTMSVMPPNEDGEEQGEEDGEVAEQVVVQVPSSGTRLKQQKKIAQAAITSFMSSGPVKPQTQKYSKSVSSMLCDTPEEVVAKRHKSKMSQPTLEHCTKKDKEAKHIVDDHVADFLYENGIPLNVVNSRSWEIMLESIGQYGPGYRSPSYHEFRVPLLERAVNRTTELRKKHEEAWKEYGCTLMSDGWTDTSHRHLINFLANSPAGTFFLGSVDASSEVANANMLADLLEKQIDKIGRQHVVQLVTDNGSNFKAAGRILMERIPHLFWTPCAAHCLDLMLEDIGGISDFKTCISLGKKVTRFIYKHGRILDLMRHKIGGDLVRPAVTRFATSFLTLASMHRHKQGLKSLVVSDEWYANSLSATTEGRQVERIVLDVPFWNTVENCLRATQPLLIALRLSDGDETPAAPEIATAMDFAKNTITDSLKKNPGLLKEVMDCYDKRWNNQMEQKLYGAALFLNPGKFFVIREKDRRQAAKLRPMFNEVLWKMVNDDDEQSKISQQADEYERSEGDCFSAALAIRDRDKKNPVLWWGAYGGLAYELQSLAKRVVSLCCSAFGCERNWSTFAHIHTKKRNRLEHKRLNKLVYVSYNIKMANRSQKLRELGAKGKNYNPLVLEEFQWENDWIEENSVQDRTTNAQDMGSSLVDQGTTLTQNPRGRRPAAVAARATSLSLSQTHARKRKRPRKTRAIEDIVEEIAGDASNDSAQDEADEVEAREPQDSESGAEMDVEDSGEGGPSGAALGDEDGFKLDETLLA